MHIDISGYLIQKAWSQSVHSSTTLGVSIAAEHDPGLQYDKSARVTK